MPHPPRPIRAFRLPAQRAPSFGQAAAADAALNRELLLHLGARDCHVKHGKSRCPRTAACLYRFGYHATRQRVP
jgi:hypothetical protein